MKTTLTDELIVQLVDQLHTLPPLEAVKYAEAARFMLNDATYGHVRDARTLGASWQQIGTALGVTRSAAQQRFGA
jgi:hypothetical protein